MKNSLSYILLLPFLAAACTGKLVPVQDQEVQMPEIRVGGLAMNGPLTAEVATKAAPSPVDAETIDWLADPLKGGLAVSYGNLTTDADGVRVENNKHVAILKLETDADGNIKDVDGGTWTPESGKFAQYSFKYKTTGGGVTEGDNARWYDNGPHYFEGVYVPDQLKGGSASGLVSDQSGENYTYLTRYLGMPADCSISATISRIRLPFKHRLSRIVAYVLIDPAMAGVTIKGYKTGEGGIEDPRTSEIRFDKVKVLDYVQTNEDGSFTPVWTGEQRKVIPHYIGENAGMNAGGQFIQGSTLVMYHHKKYDEYIAPSNPDYEKARKDYESRHEASDYEEIRYENAPCYDLIVEPSYSTAEQVMYDEAGMYNDDGTINKTKRAEWAATKNKIVFNVTLSNGLVYEKEFQFNNLDANYQTVVYLRIQRESVDYDNSGSEIWESNPAEDGYYGMNNQNGNTLSEAGSSWQRAYRISADKPVYTDGEDYLGTQNLTETEWKDAFLAATADGDHHGDYFILNGDLSVGIPEGFVFTGHLDARGHTLTLDRSLSGLNGAYVTPQESDVNADWKANVHKEGGKWVPAIGYRAELLNVKFAGVDKLFTDGAEVTGYIYNCYLGGARIIGGTTAIPEY